MTREMTIFVPPNMKLPDTKTHVNRYYVKSSSSDTLHTIAQSRTGRWWSCSCLGWIRHKHCQHLDAPGLPGHYIPCEAQIVSGK